MFCWGGGGGGGGRAPSKAISFRDTKCTMLASFMSEEAQTAIETDIQISFVSRISVFWPNIGADSRRCRHSHYSSNDRVRKILLFIDLLAGDHNCCTFLSLLVSTSLFEDNHNRKPPNCSCIYINPPPPPKKKKKKKKKHNKLTLMKSHGTEL